MPESILQEDGNRPYDDLHILIYPNNLSQNLHIVFYLVNIFAVISIRTVLFIAPKCVKSQNQLPFHTMKFIVILGRSANKRTAPQANCISFAAQNIWDKVFLDIFNLFVNLWSRWLHQNFFNSTSIWMNIFICDEYYQGERWGEGVNYVLSSP